jgi:hypothetical protein
MSIETEEELFFNLEKLEKYAHRDVSRLSIKRDPEMVAAMYDLKVGKDIRRMTRDNPDLYMKWELEIKPKRQAQWVEDFIKEMGGSINDISSGRGR